MDTQVGIPVKMRVLPILIFMYFFHTKCINPLKEDQHAKYYSNYVFLKNSAKVLCSTNTNEFGIALDAYMLSRYCFNLWNPTKGKI